MVLWGAMENASIDAVAWIQRAGIDSTLGPPLPLPLLAPTLLVLLHVLLLSLPLPLLLPPLGRLGI